MIANITDTWNVAWCLLLEFNRIYESGMRGAIFTGFITMASFLLAAKSFIVVNLKKDVYDTEEYAVNYLIENDGEESKDGKDLYTPLNDLSQSLLTCIYLALATSVLQFTLGLWHHPVASVICVVFAAYTLYRLVKVLREFKKNLDTMFEWLVEKGRSSVDKAKIARAERLAREQGAASNP